MKYQNKYSKKLGSGYKDRKTISANERMMVP